MKLLQLCLLCAFLMVRCQEDEHEHPNHADFNSNKSTSAPLAITSDITHQQNVTPNKAESQQALLNNLNNRFQSMRGCGQPEMPNRLAIQIGGGSDTCQCLWKMSYLQRIISRTSKDDRFNSKDSPGVGVESLEQLSTLMLYNVLRMNPYFTAQVDKNHLGNEGEIETKKRKWIKCHPTEAVCDEIDGQTKQTTILSMLMPETMELTNHTRSHNATIDSQVFVKDLEDLLQRLDRIVDKSTATVVSGEIVNQKCFDTEEIVLELKKYNTKRTNSEIITAAAMLIVNRLASGQCIELLESRFLNDIFERYSKTTLDDEHRNRYHNHDPEETGLRHERDGHHHHHPEDGKRKHIDEKGFQQMLNGLHIGGLIENTKSDNKTPQANLAVETSNYYQVEQNEPLEHKSHRGHRSVKNVPSNQHKHIGHTHQHLPPTFTKNLNTNGQDLKVIADAHQECLDYRFYINQLRHQQEEEEGNPLIKSEKSTTDVDVYLTPARLQKMAPIFLQQILSRACERIEPKTNFQEMRASSNEISSKNKKAKKWEIYVYSSISVLLISSASILGVLVVPFQGTRFYSHLISLLIGLAFAAMTGDALLHLLPTVLGLHSHDHHETDGDTHGHSHEEEKTYLIYICIILITMYFLFLFETISGFFGRSQHGHSHGRAEIEAKEALDHSHPQQSRSISTLTTTGSLLNQNGSSSLFLYSTDSLDKEPSNGKELSILKKMRSLDDRESLSTTDSRRLSTPLPINSITSQPIFFGMNSLAVMITFGDGVHNFFDGIAIGLAFSNSLSSGISTSIAVIFHELPHEFGDFAVLLSTGLSVPRVIAVNFFSALTAFAGLYIGILLGESVTANRIALTITAGMFLYIGLAAMIPELKNVRNEKDELMRPGEATASLILKSVGIFLGFASMVLLSLYEEKLSFL